MKLGAEQSQQMERGAAQSFETRMKAHLRKHFPEHCRALGEEGLTQAIWDGVTRAKGYEFVSERDVCKYITLMFAFGPDFDRNRNLPWAQEILRNRVYRNPADRINDLYDTAMRRARTAGNQKA